MELIGPCVSDRIDGGKAIGYPDAARLVAEAADKMNITNKTVLVIGTEVPWMETILLQRKPRSRNDSNDLGEFNLIILQKGSYTSDASCLLQQYLLC